MGAILALCCLVSVDLKGTDIATERVFGPEVPGRYKHPASITELQSGDLYLVYYGGTGEYAADSMVYGARLRKGASTARSLATPAATLPSGAIG